MDLTEMIAYYRQRVRDIDPIAYVQTDIEVAQGLESSRRQFAARQVAGCDTFLITTTPPPPAMTAVPSDRVGYLVATHAAWQYLSDEYTYKLTTGQFGVSWRSGLEEENSLQASAKYIELVNELKAEWQNWILVINSSSFATRIQ
jgi:hypothetical protein